MESAAGCSLSIIACGGHCCCCRHGCHGSQGQLLTSSSLACAEAVAIPHTQVITPSSAGIGNVGHYNDGSHNLGSRNVGSRNIGDYNLCALCIGHRLQGFSLAGPPAILPNGTDTNLKLEPTKEEL